MEKLQLWENALQFLLLLFPNRLVSQLETPTNSPLSLRNQGIQYDSSREGGYIMNRCGGKKTTSYERLTFLYNKAPTEPYILLKAYNDITLEQ